MFYPIGFGGQHWLLYLGVPADHRYLGAVSRQRRLSKMGRGPRELQYHRRGSGPRNFAGGANSATSRWSRPTTTSATTTIRRRKRLCLSSNVYNTPSVAALGIAAHETGHAIQHAKAYAPLKARMAIVPVTQVASHMLPFVIFGGLFFHITGSDHARHLLLPDPARLPVDHFAG